MDKDESSNRATSHRRSYRGGGRPNTSDSRYISQSRPKASGATSNLSLKDVAEQHELEYDHATPDLKLRYQKIQFVPAGTHTPVGPRDDDKRATTANSRQGNQEETPIDKFASMRLGSEVTENASRPKFREGGLESAEKPQTILANPAPRSLSPTPSNSSEEVVVFKGRNPTASVSSTKRPDTSAVSLKLPTPAWNDTGKDWAHREDKTARKEKKKTQDVDVARELAISQSRGPKKARKLQNRQLRDLDDEAFQDYLMNLIENDEHDAFDDVLSNTVETGGDLSDNDGDDDDVSEFDDDDDDGSDDDDDGSNLESEHDEDDLIERRKAAMTDEHIARILSKQEELGIGSAEIVLFDGVDVGEDDGRDFFVRNRGSNSSAAQSLKVRRRKRGKKKTAMEDYPYGDFDVMDFDRPSLQLRSKASVPLMAEDISDEDLRSTIQESWEADRRKKRLKKAERQELRAQGLLGKKKKRGVANSIEQNIPGMGKDEILDTIRDFLRSSSPSQSFPPLQNTQRRLLHLIAPLFGLRSQSSGKGKSRRTTLFKQAKTVSFNYKKAFAHADAILTKEFGRLGRKTPEGASKPKRLTRQEEVRATRYQDGEIVGSGAPELGAENKGRAMLEKMGWTQGTGLGSANNQGILQPIQTVVRNSKRGLG